MSTRAVCAIAGACVIAAMLSVPAQANDAVEEIVKILAERGLIDEATEQQILLKNHHQAHGTGAPSVDDGFEFMKGLESSGDFRLRNEQFWYSRGPFDAESRSNRNRWRYRVRVGFEKQVNKWFRVGARFTTSGGNRGTNQTLGSGGDDFDNDEIVIDRAWAGFRLPDLGGLKHEVVAGKVSNPFVWNNGKDYLAWDHDITPEGLDYRARWQLGQNAELFGSLGYYVIEERSTDSDPKVVGLQLGGSADLSESVEIGLRGTYYTYRSLSSDFIDRNLALGNLPGAFGDPGDRRFSNAELYAFTRLALSDAWPVLLYGQYLSNLDAKRTRIGGLGTAGKQDSAWGLGLELGKPDRWLKFGFGYFHVEANAVVAVFTDSDIVEGQTNREGWTAYIDRQLVDRVNLRLTYFDGEEIEGDTVFNLMNAGEDADRRRLQSDIVIKF